MKYYIIAGEASGDLHASNLIHFIKKFDQEAQIRGIGGDKMQAAGAQIWKHYKNTAFMGYSAVIRNLRRILKLLTDCKKDIEIWNPDVVILVDYPGFNLKIAKFAHTKQYKVCYYISPKIWAWKQHRIKQIKKYVDTMYSILPFEVDFYKKHNYEVTYVGNPVLDNIERTLDKNQHFTDFVEKHKLQSKPIIALLPGSRLQEIQSLLPTMSSVADNFSNHQIVIAAAPGVAPNFYKHITKNSNISIVHDDTYQLVKHSQAAVVASGTATLETALAGTPQVVCYKVGGGALSYALGKIVFNKIKYVSLVNLILDRQCVTELLQHRFNKKQLIKEIKQILPESNERKEMLSQYKQLRNILGEPGASERTAQNIVESLTKNR